MLSNVDIEKAVDWGSIEIGDADVEAASIDLHLGDEFVEIDSEHIVDVAEMSTYPEYEYTTTDTILIQPQQFVLAHTDEYVDLPSDMGGILHGRSSLGRLGLFVENAGFVDPSFEGSLTLELFNAAPYPIRLHEGMRAVQMVLFQTCSEPSIAYGSGNDNKYDTQSHPTPSSLWKDF